MSARNHETKASAEIEFVVIPIPEPRADWDPVVKAWYWAQALEGHWPDRLAGSKVERGEAWQALLIQLKVAVLAKIYPCDDEEYVDYAFNDVVLKTPGIDDRTKTGILAYGKTAAYHLYLRNRAHDDRHKPIDDEVGASDDSIDVVLDREEMLNILDNAFERLAPAKREALEAWQRGENMTKWAEARGLPYGTVKSNVSRAKDELRQEVMRRNQIALSKLERAHVESLRDRARSSDGARPEPRSRCPPVHRG